MTTETILTVLACLLGGVNIFQVLFLRSTKKKFEAEADAAKAEADKARTEVKQGELDLRQDQYEYVYTQLTKVQQDYNALAERYRATMTEHLNEIDAKCNEIAGLKSKVAYFRGLRCYRSSCAQRVAQSPFKEETSNPNTDKNEKDS